MAKIFLTAKAISGAPLATPRVIAVESLNMLVFGSKKTAKDTVIREHRPDGGFEEYTVYESATEIAAAASPSATDIYVKTQVALAVAALGANAAAAYAVVAYLTEVTTATASSADGVKLDAAVLNKVRVIINNNATVVLDIWPSTGERILPAAIDAGTLLNNRARKHYVCKAAGIWTVADDYTQR